MKGLEERNVPREIFSYERQSSTYRILQGGTSSDQAAPEGPKAAEIKSIGGYTLKFKSYVEFIAPSTQVLPNRSVPGFHAHPYLEVAASTQSLRGLLLRLYEEEVNEDMIRSLSIRLTSCPRAIDDMDEANAAKATANCNCQMEISNSN